jgi:FlaA1/EpsC-like NDP-sugar epimerase
MYTDENYLWGWVAYAAGVLCVLIVMWIFSRKWRFGAIRHLWLIITSVILLTPVTA